MQVADCPSLQYLEDYLRTAYDGGGRGPPTTVRCQNGQTYPMDPRRLTLLSEIMVFNSDKVELRPSPIHGRGVFAQRELKAGEIATFYPADVIEYRPAGSEGPILPIPSARELALIRPELGLFRQKEYRLELDQHYAIIGNPAFAEGAAYLGHFVNDASKCEPGSEGVAAYLQKSVGQANCKFHSIDGLHVVVLASRDIAAGEELLASYGVARWLRP